MQKHSEPREILAHKKILVLAYYHYCWHVCCQFLSCVFKFNKRGATTIKECNVRKFSDLICHTLSGTNHNPWYIFLRHRIVNNNHFVEHRVRIQDRNVQQNRYPTYKQKKNHKSCGNPFKNKCFVCRKYMHINRNNQYNTTQWWCKLCILPLCVVDHFTNLNMIIIITSIAVLENIQE